VAPGIVTFKLKFTGSERGPLAGSNCQWEGKIRVGEWGPVALSLPARRDSDRPGCGRIELVQRAGATGRGLSPL
jgi:hypothetical protein